MVHTNADYSVSLVILDLYRTCPQSIIGATLKRREGSVRVAAGLVVDSGSIWLGVSVPIPAGRISVAPRGTVVSEKRGGSLPDCRGFAWERWSRDDEAREIFDDPEPPTKARSWPEHPDDIRPITNQMPTITAPPQRPHRPDTSSDLANASNSVGRRYSDNQAIVSRVC